MRYYLVDRCRVEKTDTLGFNVLQPFLAFSPEPVLIVVYEIA